jgi:hypothetical protein
MHMLTEASPCGEGGGVAEQPRDELGYFVRLAEPADGVPATRRSERWIVQATSVIGSR